MGSEALLIEGSYTLASAALSLCLSNTNQGVDATALMLIVRDWMGCFPAVSQAVAGDPYGLCPITGMEQ